MEHISDAIRKNVRIIDYAAQIGLTPVSKPSWKGNAYTLLEHDSVRIDADNNVFYRNSTGANGGIIDFRNEAIENPTFARYYIGGKIIFENNNAEITSTEASEAEFRFGAVEPLEDTERVDEETHREAKRLQALSAGMDDLVAVRSITSADGAQSVVLANRDNPPCLYG